MMPDFAVSEEKNRLLKQKMEALQIQEKDLVEKFIRSSGHGGQKLNKTASCVYLKHLPTGIEIKCMRERSQSINRFLARRELAERIEALTAGDGKGQTVSPAMEKIRKQKARRQRKSKGKYLQETE
ncbi:MAG: peptide chain release factor-like protein [Nitrospiraceae bacterium]|nr:peptide chain release factor-like protein [Nitrospiraceae bacterium]